MVSEVLTLLRRYPAYRRLWIADATTQIGDWFSLVAVSVFSLGASGGLVALATTLAAHLLPQTLASPLSGVIADRYERRKVLLVGAGLEATLTVAMAACAYVGALLPLQLLVFARSFVSAAREPTVGAALPQLVDKADLGTANALGALTWSTTFSVGVALGGFAVGVHPTAAIAIDALTFLVAMVILRGLPLLPPVAAEPGSETPRLSVFGDAREALTIANQPRLRFLVYAKAPAAFAAGSAWIGLHIAAARNHSEGMLAAGFASTVGLLQAARAIGTGVGPAFTRRFATGRHKAIALTVTGLVPLVAIAMLGFTRDPRLAAASVFLWGAGGGALWVLTITQIQEIAPRRALGRLLALDGLVFTLAMSLASLLTAFLVDRGFASEWVIAGIAGGSGLVWALMRIGASLEGRALAQGSSIRPTV